MFCGGSVLIISFMWVIYLFDKRKLLIAALEEKSATNETRISALEKRLNITN